MAPQQRFNTLAVVGVAVLVMTVTWAFYAFFAREVTHWMEGKHHWFHDYEPWSLLGLIATFLVATSLFLPAQPFVVATGYLFGFHFLTLLFTIAVYALGAFLMFNGARFWFRPVAEGWLAEHKVVMGMSQYVRDPREGAKMNLLFSFTPIAFCIHCYVMGITEIDEFVFMGTFLIGQSPHIVLGLLTGSAMLAADTNPTGAIDTFKIVLFVAGVVGTLFAMVYLMQVAESVLHDMEHGAQSQKLLGEADNSAASARCGVGITFEEQDDRTLTVAALLPGSPAAMSGQVRLGDVLCEIDGRNVYRASLNTITRLIPGERGTQVVIGLGGAGGGQITRVSLTRRQTAGLTARKSYGTAETQTPPETPDDVERRVQWGDNTEFVYHAGESTGIGGVAEGDMGGQPIMVTVSSSTL